MGSKIKKIVFMTGFTSIGFCSLFSYKQTKYEQAVEYHSYTSDKHNGQVVAHRGFSSLEVENSLAAIDRAFKSDCTDEVEIDVRLTKDEEIVLSHDSTICGIGKISKKSLEELDGKEYSNNNIVKYKNLKDSLLNLDTKLSFDRYNDVKNNHENIVSLKTVLDAEYEENKVLLIDIKFQEENKEIFMDKLNDILKNYIGNPKIILQSLDIDALKIMKEKYPYFEYQYLLNNKEDFKYLDDNINRVAFKQCLVSQDLIKEQLDKGRTVSIWTINLYNEYKNLYNKLGDYIKKVTIITDYPDEICYLRNDFDIKKLKKSSN